MDGRNSGMVIIGVGLAVVAVGILVWLGWLSWFGRLPGDIRIEEGNTRVYIPITSMVVVSVLLSGVSYVVRRFL